MYAVENNNIGTRTSLIPVFGTETWLYTFYDPIQEIADCRVQLFCSGFFSFEEVDFWGRL